jgi:hypothetical protein
MNPPISGQYMSEKYTSSASSASSGAIASASGAWPPHAPLHLGC